MFTFQGQIGPIPLSELDQNFADLLAVTPSAVTSFTPTIKFGGANVGMTFFNQNGQYVKIGSAVFFLIGMVLNAKGSSTGAATIEGFPFTISPSPALPALYPAFCFLQNITLASAATPSLILQPNTTKMEIWLTGSTGISTPATQTQIIDGCRVSAQGVYFV